jgi:hypothetical protein
MATKHIMVVHGRATKPVREEKERLVKMALIAGLERVSRSAAQKVSGGEAKFTLAYYGDINNSVMVKAEPYRKEKTVLRDTVWYEPEGLPLSLHLTPL